MSAGPADVAFGLAISPHSTVTLVRPRVSALTCSWRIDGQFRDGAPGR
jgi:hypothetical protein